MGLLFEAVREGVTAREVAERYGLEVNRHGKAVCPWHNDRHPSLSFDKRTGRCRCFSCNHGGSAIDLTAALLGCSSLEAAKRIAADFGLNCPDAQDRHQPSPIGETPAQQRARLKAEEARHYSALCDRLHAAQSTLARFTPEAAEHSHEFAKALAELGTVQTALELFGLEAVE